MQKLIRYSAAVILLAVIAYAFFLTGSPAHNRKTNEDYATLRELQNIHYKLVALQYNKNGVLPKTLDVNLLNKAPDNSYFCSDLEYVGNFPVDAAIATKYDYTRTAKGYTICATFGNHWKDIKWSEESHMTRGYEWAKDFTQGKNCFERAIPECKKRT